jgi:ubiquinone/menaquinone biosynthesis C-methylase UbiE
MVVAKKPSSAEAKQYMSRVSDAMDKLNGVGGINGQGDAEVKEVIATLYSGVAAAPAGGDLWNWGFHDQPVHQEIERLAPDFDRFGTDGLSEQLYYYTLRAVPLEIGDYAGKHVLEIGSGPGGGLNFLSRIFDGAKFSGVDISPIAVGRANACYSRADVVTFTCGDAESIPFEDGSVDVVINVESAHNYPNLDSFLSEVSRVLKPSGHFSMVDMFSEHRRELFDRAKAGSAQLDWTAENDISQQVKNSIRRRLEPGSHMNQQFSRQRMSALQRVVGKHCMQVACGAPFTGQASTSPIAKWSRKVGGLSSADRFPVRAYVHHLATRIS